MMKCDKMRGGLLLLAPQKTAGSRNTLTTLQRQGCCWSSKRGIYYGKGYQGGIEPVCDLFVTAAGLETKPATAWCGAFGKGGTMYVHGDDAVDSTMQYWAMTVCSVNLHCYEVQVLQGNT
jgi:hypothetical protein